MAEAGGDFLDVYRHFLAATDCPADAYRHASRLFRGSLPAAGAFTKDLAYARGLLDVFRFVRSQDFGGPADRIDHLFCGKVSLADMPLIAELDRLGLVVPPRFVPPIVRDRRLLAHHLATLPALRPSPRSNKAKLSGMIDEECSTIGVAIMSQITLDPAALAKLAALDNPVDVVDDSGKVLGKFIPRFDPSEWEIVGEEESIEELERELQDPTGKSYTTEEVLAYLRSLK